MQNFKSFGQLTVVDFQHLTGLNYIFGTNKDAPSSRNGCGKSNLIDGIVFALYGRTIKNTSIPYIPNRYCDKKLKTYVKLWFEVDGVLYTAQSSCKPYIKHVTMVLQQYEPQTDTWKDLTQSSVIKTKQYIAQTVLNCSFDLFKSSIIISASDCLNFYDMTKQEKRNYIENIFNLNCFGVMYDMIKSDLNNLKREITYNNNQIVKSTNQLEQLKQKFEDYDNQLAANIVALEKEIEKKSIDLDKVNDAIDKLNKKLSQYNIDSQKYKEMNKNLKTFITAKNTIEKSIIKNQSKITNINNTITQITNIKQGLCETCKEVVNNYFNYNEKLNEIDELNRTIEESNGKIAKLDQNIESFEKQIETYEQENNNVNKLQSDLNKLLTTSTILQNDIKRIKKQQEQQQEQHVNPFDEMIAKTEEELTMLTKQTSDYHNSLKHLDILKEVCSQNGVKSFIIKDIVKLFNSLIQKYLNEIGAEYIVYFDESFDFKFITMTGECEYTNFSAGERQRIQIATIFAFRDLILNGKLTSNIFIIDEFLDTAIDSICIKNVLEILYKKTQEQHQNIFIISHRQETTQNHIFNNIIEVIKQNGISTLNIN